MVVKMNRNLTLLCTSFHCQRLTANDGVTLFVEQGVIEMGLKDSVICSKYFLGSKFDSLGQYKLGTANKTFENLLAINCTVVVCKTPD